MEEALDYQRYCSILVHYTAATSRVETDSQTGGREMEEQDGPQWNLGKAGGSEDPNQDN